MVSDTAIYTDFSALTELKKDAREKSPEAIKEVAKQFESLFVQMMLKSMRETVPENELFGSKSEKTYQDMYDKQLSMQISNGKGIGLADVIERQLGGKPDSELNKKRIEDYLSDSRPVDRPFESNVTLHKLRKDSVGNTSGAQDVKNIAPDEAPTTAWQSVKEFINDIWPHAQRAAKKLGIDADVLVAQSALETGWGKHTPKHADGSNSFNLFGIKADNRWQGDKVEIMTREVRHGVMQQEKAEFRSYDSVSQSFEDYASFIMENPRYQKALEHGYDSSAYARELQKAGYATDPEYANKINRVRGNEVLQAELKKIENVPLT
ncbi:MAG: flagellar assembly peptidoglycan hydrolase FlgJ [endosymbiont of Galathealinum brachiosum]|uniref:Peptidoglycan hydrolase FlgJ n=1 Tax=endosymbiont of Galathealinum brachiosum TaxID=2200906 RepID=A0A370DKM8_9GAMM|nr:MAG: flagellar assembly peptidoglycan hydrolase FlgJ [endosymbiont of Galathealinum brachiosum]